MKNYVQLAASCCFAWICCTGLGLSAEAPPPSAEIQKNLDTLLTSRACPSCNLAGAELTRLKLTGVNLEGANLAGARLLLTDLVGANLRGTNLSGANLGGADLARADLSGADLSGAVLEGAFISQTQIQSASGYVPEQKVQIPESGPPSGSETADIQEPESTEPANTMATMPTAPAPGINVTEEAGMVASKPLPIAPEDRPVAVTSSQETTQAALTEDAQKSPTDTPAAAPDPVTAGVSAAKPLPVAPGTDVETVSSVTASARPDDGAVVASASATEEAGETVAAGQGDGTAAASAPQAEAVVSEPNRQPAEIVPAEVESDIATTAPSDNRAADADRDQLVKQMFKQKQCIDCNLSGLDFSGRDFEKFDLERANFQGSNLSRTDLRRANLKGANLRGATLLGADLRKADLYRADLSGADLTDARLGGALLDSANLDGATGTIPAQPGERQ